MTKTPLQFEVLLHRPKVIGDVCAAIHRRDSVAGQLIGDRGEDRCVATIMPQPTVPQIDRTPVRELAKQPERVVHAGLGHPAHHDRLRDAPAAEQPDPASGAEDARHPELVAAIRARRDFAERGNFASDPHGTAVAGIIGAASDNGFGIAGVAPDAALDVLRACWYPEGEAAAVCDSFTLAKALTHALESDSDIINLSLGGPTDALLARLVTLAISRGIVVVAAAPQRDGFPANVPGVIVVGAEGDGRASQLHAPGVDILVPVPGGGFDYASGSSLSAAHVTGVIALLVAERPGIGRDDVASLLAGSRNDDSSSINACRALARMLERAGCHGGAAAQNNQ